MKQFCKRLLSAGILSLALAVAPAVSARDGGERWSAAVIDAFGRLPVQDGGRVKPLHTYARFTLIKFSGKGVFRTASGARLKPEAWLLDVLFYPQQAGGYRHFIVDNWEIVEALGLRPHEDKRDRYSYQELLPGREWLFQLAIDYSKLEAQNRTAIEQGVINLAHNLRHFELLGEYLDPARLRLELPADTQVAAMLPNPREVPPSAFLRELPAMMRALQSGPHELSPEQLRGEQQALERSLRQLEFAALSDPVLRIIPPETLGENDDWLGLPELIGRALQMQPPNPRQLQMLGQLEQMTAGREDPAEFQAQLEAFAQNSAALAAARKEFAHIPLEVHFYRARYLFYSQWLYVLSFVCVALLWLKPRSPRLYRAANIALLPPTLLLLAGITLRCIIRGRPPITTLYETILFITAAAVLIALFSEYVNRQRIALAVGSIFGVIGMFLAQRYEIKEGVDTMPSLVAVLDTNFWLATHVTVINLGYAAGLLAAGLAHAYVFGKLFGAKKAAPDFFPTIARMTYGVVCFCLLFSIVGTILGGIWANESWGRFWGWDPKENGALMICLWGLIILHARLGHYVGELGVCLGAIVLGMIVAFSWWGVNLLGVGLHSYGFTSGVMRILLIFWSLESLVLALGGIVSVQERGRKLTAVNGRQSLRRNDAEPA